MSAREAPKKTVSLFTSAPEAYSSVASCVLSPISAIKMVLNTVNRSFQSISTSWESPDPMPAEDCGLPFDGHKRHLLRPPRWRGRIQAMPSSQRRGEVAYNTLLAHYHSANPLEQRLRPQRGYKA